jgi:NADH-quinone oxidoreductase subunit K
LPGGGYKLYYHEVLILSFILFGIGILGFLVRRNIFIILMCVELMLNSANLVLVNFSRMFNDVNGQVYVLIVLTVAAAEAGVGLAIVIMLFRNLKTVFIDEINKLRG